MADVNIFRTYKFSFSNLPFVKSALHHHYQQKNQPGSQLGGRFTIYFYHVHPLPKGGIFPIFGRIFFGEWVGSTTNVTSEAWVASEVRVPEDGSLPRLTPRMPVVKMEMEPQKVALEDEDLRF